MRRALVLLLVATSLLVPAAAQARIPIRVGIGDQSTTIFDQPAFQRAKFERVRYFVPWNIMGNPGQLTAATQWVQTARAHGFQILLHVSTDDFRIKKAKLPTVSQYHTQVGSLVRYFRALGVRDFGTWNEAN